MKICVSCKKEVILDKFFARKTTCPHCKADLHICLNCRFSSETAHNKCLEPKAEFQRTRDKTNFCDYFVFRESGGKAPSKTDAEDVRKKFEDLFKK